MEEFEIRDEGYTELAIAIVKQAADDYRRAYRRYLRSGNRNPTVDYIEDWLISGDGAILSFGKGAYILQTIRDEEDAKNGKVKKQKRQYNEYTYNGQTMTAQEWANELDVSVLNFQKRIYRNLPPEKVFAPRMKKRRKS